MRVIPYPKTNNKDHPRWQAKYFPVGMFFSPQCRPVCLTLPAFSFAVCLWHLLPDSGFCQGPEIEHWVGHNC